VAALDEFLSELMTGIQSQSVKYSRGDVHLSEDLASEAVVACIRVFDRYSDRPASEMILLAGRAATNAMRDHLRWLSGRPVAQEPEIQVEVSRPDTDQAPGVALSHDLYVMLRAALSRNAKLVLDQSVGLDETGIYPIDLTVQELARKLRLSQGAVHAAKAELRDLARGFVEPDQTEPPYQVERRIRLVQ
jgi:hypothetical protein